MKTIITTIALLLTLLVNAQEATHTLKVTVPNATKDDGKMVFSLNTEATFMKAQPIQAASVEIKDGVAVATFENVPSGEYAIIVLHDLNGNEQMDFENGMPAENYATSGGSTGFGPPNWGDSKFTLDENAEMNIRL